MTTTTIRNDQRGLHSQALDLLRFPLALIVVAAHAIPILNMGDIFFGKAYNFENYPICVSFFNFFFAFFRRQSVPIYFFISGYVFFLNVDSFTKDKYFQKIKNRINTLLIPYLAWNTIAIVCFLIINLPNILQTDAINPHWFFSAYWIYDGNFLITPNGRGTCDPIIGPLWFLRNLMIVVLATPVIYTIVKKFKHYPSLFLGAIWLYIRVCKPDYINIDRLITSFFFFSWGAQLSILKKDLVYSFSRFSKPMYAGYLFLGGGYLIFSYHHPFVANIFKQVSFLLGPPVAFNLAFWLLKNGKITTKKSLSATGFFIYASHMLIMDRILGITSRFASTDLGVLLSIIFAIVSTISILLIIYWVLKRLFPPLLTILTGRK